MPGWWAEARLNVAEARQVRTTPGLVFVCLKRLGCLFVESLAEGVSNFKVDVPFAVRPGRLGLGWKSLSMSGPSAAVVLMILLRVSFGFCTCFCHRFHFHCCLCFCLCFSIYCAMLRIWLLLLLSRSRKAEGVLKIERPKMSSEPKGQ